MMTVSGRLAMRKGEQASQRLGILCVLQGTRLAAKPTHSVQGAMPDMEREDGTGLQVRSSRSRSGPRWPDEPSVHAPAVSSRREIWGNRTAHGCSHST